jgi:hypothetical protein
MQNELWLDVPGLYHKIPCVRQSSNNLPEYTGYLYERHKCATWVKPDGTILRKWVLMDDGDPDILKYH